MMLAIDVQLLHGSVRAAPPTDETLTGVTTNAEWPLSPARLFSAFVAADGTGERCRVTDGSELALLETAAPPTIFADDPAAVLHNPLRERFVVLDQRDESMMQGYPARKPALVRPGTRVDPRTPRLTYVYDDVEPTDQELSALRRRAARIGYVGCADSPARVTVCTDAPFPTTGRWEAGVAGTSLPVPFEGLLEALDRSFASEQAGGVNRRSWIPSRFIDYGDPRGSDLRVSGRIYPFSLDRRVAGHKALLLTEAFRRAVLAVTGDDAPSVLHGHGMMGQRHLQARYLTLPFAGHENADGDVRGVALWLPPDVDDDTDRSVRAALIELTELNGRGFGRRRLRPAELDHARTWSVQIQRWSGLPYGATTWRSVTPVVHERHARTDLAEVQRWFEHAGHPAPIDFKTMHEPFITGGIRLRPSHLRPRYGDHRFGHIEVTFAEPVAGPLVVGRGRQFGMGLLAPVRPDDRAEEAL